MTNEEEKIRVIVAWIPCRPEFLKKGQVVMHNELGRCHIFEVFLENPLERIGPNNVPTGVALDPLNEEGKSKNNDGSIFLTPDEKGVFQMLEGPIYFKEEDFTQFLCDPWDRAFPDDYIILPQQA